MPGQANIKSDTEAARPKSTRPRPLFVYGTLCAKPLLATILTGDRSNTEAIGKLMQPARVSGYQRFAVTHCDYPAVIKADPASSVEGYLLTLETRSQRSKLDNFEGETYKPTQVNVTIRSPDGQNNRVVDADIYVWTVDPSALSTDPWDLDDFLKERLNDWLDLFEGMLFCSDEEEE
jgi:gamma-glutamylcyclotransferase (GGCT)/AIG2-like uncharacterized protein YtfP